MLRHLGYLAATQSIDAWTGRGCRPHEATPDRIRALVRDNLSDLARILLFNADHGIAFYRVSSHIIPFAADPGNAVGWWDEFAGELEQIGQFIRRHGLRLEMHPGHHCLLNAPSPETVALSILVLGWHVRFLDALQADASHKLVLRVGGTFGDKGGSIARFVSVINGLPDEWKGRLVVENDEARYDVLDVLGVSGRTGLPVVFDFLDHRINPSSDPDTSRLIARCFQTWKAADGPPIVHLGSMRHGPGGGTMSSDWVEPADIETLMVGAPADIPFDCLLEATQGDRALFDLRERLAVREFGGWPNRFDASPSPIY